MKQLLPRLTYANVMATLAFFIALGGASAFAATQLGKNTVGTRQVKNGAITAAKIKNGTITGSKIEIASLGTVPSAAHAESATTASTAGNSTQLGGAAAATYRDHCPGDTSLAAPAVCASSEDGASEFFAAVETCGNLGLRLPTVGESRLIFRTADPEHPFWTADFWVNGTTNQGLVFWGEKEQLYAVAATGYYWIYCVTTPTND